jgi:hypothetical protein
MSIKLRPKMQNPRATAVKLHLVRISCHIPNCAFSRGYLSTANFTFACSPPLHPDSLPPQLIQASLILPCNSPPFRRQTRHRPSAHSGRESHAHHKRHHGITACSLQHIGDVPRRHHEQQPARYERKPGHNLRRRTIWQMRHRRIQVVQDICGNARRGCKGKQVAPVGVHRRRQDRMLRVSGHDHAEEADCQRWYRVGRCWCCHGR